MAPQRFVGKLASRERVVVQDEWSPALQRLWEQEEHHLTGGPPLWGHKQTRSRLSGWKLEGKKRLRSYSAPPFPELSSSSLSRGKRFHFLCGQTWENFGPRIEPSAVASMPAAPWASCARLRRLENCALAVILFKVPQSLSQSRGHCSEDASPEGPCGSAEHLPGYHHQEIWQSK